MAQRAFAGLSGRVAGLAISLGTAATVAQSTMYDVQPGHRAVIFDRFTGVKPYIIPEGTHFLIPILQRPIIFDIRTRPRTISTTTGTKDLQVVNLSLRVLSKPNIKRLPELYQQLGLDYDERVLPSIGNEVLKSTVAQYNADQLLTMRDKVSRDIRVALTQRSAEFNILLDDVSVIHINFSREFSAAIEQKQVAQQEAERSKFVVLKAEQEKQAAVIQAEGESQAAVLISDAIAKSGNGLLAIRRIETAKHVADTLSRSRNVTYLPSGNSMLLNVNPN